MRSGNRMSGGPSWALNEPSRKLHHRVDDALGVNQDRDPVEVEAERDSAPRCTSRALLTSVAESTVIRRPMSQFGCRRACSGVTVFELVVVHARNGPPLAVRISPFRRSGCSPRRGIGRSRSAPSRPGSVRPPRSRAVVDQRAGGHQGLLVGEGETVPGFERGQRVGQAGNTHDAFMTIASGVAARAARASEPNSTLLPPRALVEGSPLIGDPAGQPPPQRRDGPRARADKLAGPGFWHPIPTIGIAELAATSSVWRPIEPGGSQDDERPCSQKADGAEKQIGGRNHEEQSVDPVEHARHDRAGPMPMSLTPRLRLIIDSAASPSGASTTTRSGEDQGLAQVDRRSSRRWRGRPPRRPRGRPPRRNPPRSSWATGSGRVGGARSPFRRSSTRYRRTPSPAPTAGSARCRPEPNDR